MNIVLIGYRGTGKSTIGKVLAARLGWPLVSTDAEIVRREGRSVPEIVAQHGWEYFRDFEWPWYMPSIEEYKKLVKPFSLSEIKIWGEKADYLFPDSESIVGWINQPSIVPFLKLLPENQKELFRNFVIEQMLKNTAQENGGYFETFRRINIYAKNANA